MSIIYRRPDSPVWYVTATRKSTRTTSKTDALEFAKRATRQKWEATTSGDKPRTFGQLADTWLDEKSDKRSLSEDRFFVADFSEYLISRKLAASLPAITRDVIRAYAKHVAARSSPARANHLLVLLRAMLNLAVREEWIDKRPTITMYTLPKREPTWLTREDYKALLGASAPWKQDIITFGAHTGLRAANLLGLRWAWLDPGLTIATVPAVFAKTARTYTVPLSREAQRIIAKRAALRCSDLVFWDDAHPGKLIKEFTLKKEAKRAGIRHVRPHDLRHTFASWHTQAGTPDRVIQEIAGWVSGAMLQNYAHLNVGHLAAYADNLEAPTAVKADAKENLSDFLNNLGDSL